MPEAQQQTTEIAESALEQIAALEAKKDSRTIAQQKIDFTTSLCRKDAAWSEHFLEAASINRRRR